VEYMTLIFDFLKSNAETANAIAALTGVFIALCALLISWSANRTASKSIRIQHNHNVLSLKPIPSIKVADYENSLRVRLRNDGMGTMFIKSVEFKNKTTSKTSLIALMPQLPYDRNWNNFTTDLANGTLLPSKHLPLLELTEREGENNFCASRDIVRNKLKDIVASVTYTEVYDTEFNTYSKGSEWFGRTIK